jgi:hypothetical protein
VLQVKRLRVLAHDDVWHEGRWRAWGARGRRL